MLNDFITLIYEYKKTLFEKEMKFKIIQNNTKPISKINADLKIIKICLLEYMGY